MLTLLWLALCLPPAVLAQAEGCDDVSALPESPRVDYFSEIQPIWEIRCSNCHVNHGDSPSAGLSLDSEDSWFALVQMPSAQVTDALLVVPGQVASSYLFEKINCELPTAGQRMPRGRTPIPLAEQALIRDWIRQGAREFAVPILFEDGFEPAPNLLDR